MMKLLNEAIINALLPLRSTESIPLANKTIICKFYMPKLDVSWYIFEGEANKDPKKLYTFFGLLVKEKPAVNEVYMAYFHLADLIQLMEKGYDIQVDTTISMMPYDTVLTKVVDKAWPICQKFLIEKIIRALPPLYSTRHILLKDKKTVCEFHLPDFGTWYVFEGEFNYEVGYRFLGLFNGIEKDCGCLKFADFLKLEKHFGPVVSLEYSSALNPLPSDIFKAEGSD